MGNEQKLDAGDICLALLGMYFPDGGTTCLVNAYVWGGYESDFARITRAGYVQEFEVKVSVADFRADFQKADAKYQWDGWDGDRPNERRWSEPKHLAIRQGRSGLSAFSFVTPVGMLKAVDIPSYSGWYEAELGEYRVQIHERKKPPRLPGAKAIEVGRHNELLRSFYYRHSRIEIDRWNRQEAEMAERARRARLMAGRPGRTVE